MSANTNFRCFKGERVDVDVEPMFIFLFKDGTEPLAALFISMPDLPFFFSRIGTVISIHPKTTLAFTSPIIHRLRQPDTVLRKSPDASILVHGLLDLSTYNQVFLSSLGENLHGPSVVDRALQVVDAYHTKINKFERDILIAPQVKTMRSCTLLRFAVKFTILTNNASSAYHVW
jgi:hypothetical protein